MKISIAAVTGSVAAIWYAAIRTRASKLGLYLYEKVKNPDKIDEFFVYCGKYRVWRGEDLKVYKYFGILTKEVKLSWADRKLLKNEIKTL